MWLWVWACAKPAVESTYPTETSATVTETSTETASEETEPESEIDTEPESETEAESETETETEHSEPPIEVACTIAWGSVTTVPVLTVDSAGARSVTFGWEHEVRHLTVEDGPILLFGVPEGVAFWYEATTTSDPPGRCSGTATNGTPPKGLPGQTVTVLDAAAMSGEVLLTPYMGSPGGVVAWERQTGRTLWYQAVPVGTRISTAHLGPSGPMWLDLREGGTVLVEADWTGAPVRELPILAGHHDFVPFSDGAVAWLASSSREIVLPPGLQTVIGDRVDRLEPDGVTRTTLFDIWEVYPDFAIVPGDEWDPKSDVHPWTHANGLRWRESERTMLMSLGYADAVFELSEAGDVRRQFGGTGGYIVAPPLDFQHDPGWTDAGTLLVSTSEGGRTFAIEYAVDDGARTLTELWRCGHDEGLYQPALGMARRLTNGNTLVQWGNLGVMIEYTPDCRAVWRADCDRGGWFGTGDVWVPEG